MPQPKQLDYRNRDLRGYDFSGADLARANFQGVYTAQSQSQIIIRRTVVTTFAVILPFAVIGALGYTSSFGFAALLIFIILFSLPIVFIFLDEPLPKEVAFGVTFIGSAFATTVALAVAVASKAVSVFSEINLQKLADRSYNRDPFLIGMGYLSFSLVVLSFSVYSFLELLKILKARPGTTFNKVDLSEADFTGAVLQNADFSEAILDHINWTGARFFHCKFPESFEDNVIQTLCTSRNGYKQDYTNINLKNLYLKGVDLTRANLNGANLSGSNLQDANLENTNLCNAQALGADFTNAILTGACIQNWGINTATRFDDIQCDYIYLEPNQQERRPASGIFQPSDFAKLVHQFTDTLDFLFRNGIEAEAFDAAMKNLLATYPNANLSLKAVVDVGDGDRLVKFNVANPEADKAAMHAQLMHDYESMQKQLEAARAETQALHQDLAHTQGQLTVYREQSVFLQQFVYHQTDRFSRPSLHASSAHFAGDFMANNDNSIQFGNVQGDVSGIAGGDISGVAGKDITGAAGGDISSTLTLTLSQLEATKNPEALKLADLLKQLKSAIEKPDSGLDAKDKEKALKHVDAIAKLGNDPKNADLLEKAGDALDALPTIIKRGNGLMEFAEKYLPTITAGIKTVLATVGVSW